MFLASSSRCCRCAFLHIAVFSTIFSVDLYAANWSINPTINLTQSYSDNISLEAAGNEDRDLVTQINPSIALSAKGARVKVVFDYSLQNLIYSEQSSKNTTYQQLDFTTDTEVLRKQLFFGTVVKRTQVNSDRGELLTGDNVNGVSRATATTYSVRPQFQHDFGGDLELEMGYGLTRLELDNSDVGVSTGIETKIDLRNGRHTNLVQWNIKYDARVVRQEGVDNAIFRRTSGQVDYRLTRWLSGLVLVVNENNDILSAGDVANEGNGSYAVLGIGWHPSQRLETQLFYGSKFKSASALIKPTVHTIFKLAWQKTDIGINTGEVWSGQLQLKLRKAEWNMTYSEDATSYHETQVEENTNTLDPVGLGGFRPTEDLFIRKRGQLSFKKKFSKSELTLVALRESRVALQVVTAPDSDMDSTLHGGSIKFSWDITPKLNLAVQKKQETQDFDNNDAKSTLSSSVLTLGFTASAKSKFSLNLRKTDRDVEIPLSTETSYLETRIDASYQYYF